MELFESLTGALMVEFTSADPEKTLESITSAKISIAHVVQHQNLTYRIQIRHSDSKKLSDILYRQNAAYKIVDRSGLYWILRKSFRRPVLMATVLTLLILSVYLPSRIFFVTVDGNKTIPSHQILSAAEACGIEFGASRKLIRSESMKNNLLSAIPQLQWAGINTKGCVAVISVRERAGEDNPKENRFSNLVADQDGYILSTTITSGTAHVQPGDCVTKGQLLISGYTDCGLCIRTARAEGEIFAQTSRTVLSVTPKNYAVSIKNQKAFYKISLLLRKKRINLWKDSRISDTTCGRMYEEYYVSLPGRFKLPVAICVDQYFEYDLQDAAASEAIAQRKLQEFSEDYLMQQMISGQVILKQHHLMYSKTLYILESSYVCTEMIGKERREQIGVTNGKGY